MLELKNIVKTYKVGDNYQNALNGISIRFRKCEFVSILGQSGSGKTTTLNIIGGLDHYTSGDLIINHVSTKEYKDSDWDYYRNHSIGFVFQSYNLIPHQSVLTNVEMALTLAGVSKKERKKRAMAVLKQVGLEDHMDKKPNQMSGGQMQRVAIARALVNNPEILLADEPTGALDSKTSIQIMELLKEIAKDRLVIMVTHNPELAEKYSTRIVSLKDGRIVKDTNPYEQEETETKPAKKKKISMSFKTALSLSLDNLKTKKGRTILTAFSGSIGIIGIALVLSLSTGMNNYINNIQKETMSSYPITISEQSANLGNIMSNRKDTIESNKSQGSQNTDKEGIHIDYSDIKNSQKASSSIVTNNLTDFKKYIEDPENGIQDCIGENGIRYTYDLSFDCFSYNSNQVLIDSKDTLEKTNKPVNGILSAGSQESNFSQLPEGKEKNTVSSLIQDNYQLLSGTWPESKNEAVLVLDKNSSLSSLTMYQLGLITKEQYQKAKLEIQEGKEPETISFDYKDILNKTYYLLPSCNHYIQSGNGTYQYLEDENLSEDYIKDKATKLEIKTIIKEKEDLQTSYISTPIAYPYSLTEYIIQYTDESDVVKAQEKDKEIDILNGTHFSPKDDEAKAEDTKNYLTNLSVSEKAQLYTMLSKYLGAPTGSMDEESMAKALDSYLSGNPSTEILLKIYDQYIGENSYEDNLKAFGKTSLDTPSSISIYTDSFENKEKLTKFIDGYNQKAGKENQIVYTDYVALITSSITTIIDSISYVLIAFVSVSLIVSCIMIGIITHISVMERTKEIGILRALGASKFNISEVFNAETFLIGCLSGLIGTVLSYLCLFPINAIIRSLSGITGLSASLPFTNALILILISILITMLGGILPSMKAAKKDPVIALRSE